MELLSLVQNGQPCRVIAVEGRSFALVDPSTPLRVSFTNRHPWLSCSCTLAADGADLVAGELAPGADIDSELLTLRGYGAVGARLTFIEGEGKPATVIREYANRATLLAWGVPVPSLPTPAPAFGA
jgi:hypothetical protein